MRWFVDNSAPTIDSTLLSGGGDGYEVELYLTDRSNEYDVLDGGFQTLYISPELPRITPTPTDSPSTPPSTPPSNPPSIQPSILLNDSLRDSPSDSVSEEPDADADESVDLSDPGSGAFSVTWEEIK